MNKNEEDLLLWEPEVVEVKTPDEKHTVHLRYPSFDDWYAVVTEHRDCVGKIAPATLVAKTLVACVCKKNGDPMFTADSIGQIMKANPERVMWLYERCLKTVLKNDDQEVQEVEKNSAAGQD
ncbi:MAG: hypothetical protein RLZZ21_275 [Planctomycetota bacterium]|jgi:hypothetical protein